MIYIWSIWKDGKRSVFAFAGDRVIRVPPRDLPWGPKNLRSSELFRVPCDDVGELLTLGRALRELLKKMPKFVRHQVWTGTNCTSNVLIHVDNLLIISWYIFAYLQPLQPLQLVLDLGVGLEKAYDSIGLSRPTLHQRHTDGFLSQR